MKRKIEKGKNKSIKKGKKERKKERKYEYVVIQISGIERFWNDHKTTKNNTCFQRDVYWAIPESTPC